MSNAERSILSYLLALFVSLFVIWFVFGAALELGANLWDLGYYVLPIWLFTAAGLYAGLCFVLKTKWRLKLTQPWIITGISGVLIALIMAVAVIALQATTDGTEKFSGVEREAARLAIQSAEDRDQGPAIRVPWKYRVTAIHKGTQLNKCVMEQRADDNLSYYSATIEGVWLFGIHETSEEPVCQF